MVIVCDDEDRENEGDLTMAAAVRHRRRTSTSWPRKAAASSASRSRRSAAASSTCRPMTSHNEARLQTAFTVSVEAREGVTTGISAADRAHTIQVAIDPESRPGGPRAAGPRVPAHGPAGRRARALRADRGGRRPGQARRPQPVRRHLRDHERRRHHGARAGPRPVRAQARAQDHHRRRPHQVPAPQRAPGAARRHGRDADQVRRLQGHRLRVGARRQPPRGASSRATWPARRTCSCASTPSA